MRGVGLQPNMLGGDLTVCVWCLMAAKAKLTIPIPPNSKEPILYKDRAESIRRQEVPQQ